MSSHAACVYRALRAWVLIAGAAAAGCGPDSKQTESKPAALAKDTPRVESPAPQPPAAAPVTPPRTEEFGEGWSRLSLNDSLPICIFSSFVEREKYPFARGIKKQSLRANATAVIGVFGPWCLNEACDARPNLQCWIEPDGNTLNVRTKFFSFHKDGASCTTDCMEIDSACETPELAPGRYTIRHGEKTYELKIPSVVRSPCFDTK